jgi:pimeloyl-ACP methyl ester carboxylesterase
MFKLRLGFASISRHHTFLVIGLCMATDKFDFVLMFNGGDPFAKTGNVEPDVDLKPYLAKRDKSPQARRIFPEARGADDDVGANAESVMQAIRRFCNQRIDAIGQVVLLGRSAGCTLALELAATLNEAGVKELAFVGLSDVPMWDAGRSPAAPKVGNFKPTNTPLATGAVNPHPGVGGFLSIGPVPQNTIPEVALARSISARKKVNLLQIQGNHMKYANSLKRWIWWSTLSAGEVHGKLGDNFDNRVRRVKGSYFGSDLSFHVALNTQEHWMQMCREASAELANF